MLSHGDDADHRGLRQDVAEVARRQEVRRQKAQGQNEPEQNEDRAGTEHLEADRHRDVLAVRNGGRSRFSDFSFKRFVHPRQHNLLMTMQPGVCILIDKKPQDWTKVKLFFISNMQRKRTGAL